MSIIKSILIWLNVGIITLLFILLILIASFITLPFDFKRRIPHVLANLWARVIFTLNPITKISIQKEAHLDKSKTYIIIFNHQSFADIISLGCIGLNYKWIGKESMFKIPLFGFSLRQCGYISVRRGDRESHTKCLYKAKYWLSEGVSIVISPEGTRSKDGEIGPFKSGFARLAIEFGLPVLPISIYGARDILPKGNWIFPQNSGVKVFVGKPIDTKGYTEANKDKLVGLVRNVMVENFNQLRDSK